MKIVIADDHAMTRAGIITALSEMYPAADIIECQDAACVLLAAKSTPLDLAIVDLFMPGSDGFLLLKKLCNSYPELPVAVLSASDNPNHVRKTFDLGVSGFIHKSSSFELMHEAINKVLAGGTYKPSSQTVTTELDEAQSNDYEIPLNREALLSSLTKRQLDILICLAKGQTNKAIASQLSISENTVKTHLKALMVALSCQNRTEAGVMAEKLGLLPN